jgi:hypothetical protein
MFRMRTTGGLLHYSHKPPKTFQAKFPSTGASAVSMVLATTEIREAKSQKLSPTTLELQDSVEPQHFFDAPSCHTRGSFDPRLFHNMLCYCPYMYLKKEEVIRKD